MQRAVAAFALLLLVAASVPGEAGGETVEVIPIDTDERIVDPPATASFNWTLRNVDDLGQNFTVWVDVSGTRDWNHTIVPRTASLGHGEAETFTVTVDVPEGTEGRFTITVEFWIETTAPVKRAVEEVTILTRAPEEEEEETLVFARWKNPLPAPLDNDYGVFIMDVVLWLCLAGLALVVMDPFIRAATKRTRMKIDDMVLGIIRTPIIILIFLYGAIISLSVLENILGTGLIDLFERLYQVVFWLIVFYVAYKLFKEIIVFYGRLLAKRTATELDDVVIPLVEKIGILVIGLIALGTVFSYMGVDLTLFLAGGFVMSLVIAFAAQETLSNFFSGIFILSDRPFKRGDSIILADEWYEVRDIGIRSTRLFRFSDGAMISLPNNKLANEMIANLSNQDDPGKVTMLFSVGHGTDTEKVKGILRDIIKDCPHVITDDPAFEPIINFDEFAESALIFRVIVHISDRKQRFPVKDHINTEVHLRFAAAGIDIPFPQLDVHMKKEDA